MVYRLLGLGLLAACSLGFTGCDRPMTDNVGLCSDQHGIRLDDSACADVPVGDTAIWPHWVEKPVARDTWIPPVGSRIGSTLSAPTGSVGVGASPQGGSLLGVNLRNIGTVSN